ncbi:hypothetical protein A7976_04975 [Methylobacillus sp. MM3]|uniref:TIGR03016 family PEP-CTERM system-associated outer membrane protein n=1 Tax=Methylobacillus sp. MM3 TaxID=1848039 RepID=UPI0007E0BC9C|nr:TIGR03016 family PEP-CTERM system-associated outer membrane protein [Methylobacillus sp. MM3]OAJ69567.1 hypothetical protein A7976_04975 [Methylobacillus sp. MM3]
MLLLSLQAHAVEWEFTPTLQLKETYTDNVRLSNTNEESDFITQVNPGISIVGLGPHLRFNTRYVMQNLLYAKESDRNATNHQLNANGNAELLPDHLFVDAQASISQRSTSSFGPQSEDNTNITNNRTNVETYSFSPYLLHHFKDLADAELRYTRDSVSTSGSGSSISTGLQDSTSDRILLRLTSGDDFQTLGWGLNYNKQRIDFDSGQQVDQVTYGGDLRYRLSRKFSLIANGGYEKNDYLSITGDSGGSFWKAGFDWTPSRRTSVEALAGKRYYGDSYSLKASHRSRRTAFNVSYSEDVTTTRDQFLLPAAVDTAALLDQLWTSAIPDPIVRQQVVAAFISQNGLPESLADSVNFLTNRFFLQKRFQASMTVTGVRNTGVLSLFHTRREAQTAQSSDSALLGVSDFSADDNIKQQGVQAQWIRDIGPRTSANLGISLIKTKAVTTGREDEEKTLKLGVTKELLSNIRGALEFRRRDRDSTQDGSEYKENALTASVYITF